VAGALKAGPKAQITAPPLNLKGLPRVGGRRAVRWIERTLVIPKGKGALTPVRLRPWQRDLVEGLFDDPRPRTGLLSIPRGNGKTALAAMLALYALYADGEEGAQVLAVASDERQAGILFAAARRMVELAPELLERTHIYRDRLIVPHTASELRPLPSEAAALQGYDPSFCVVDELHVVTEDVWEAMTLAAGKRERSLTLAISTPSGDQSGVMWRLREQALTEPDPALYFREYAAPPGCAVDDEQAWHIANPALGDFLHVDALRANLKTSRESAFRRYRLGQWASHDQTWLPDGAWLRCADRDRQIEDGTDVVLALDGSFNGDSTALVVATVGECPHLDVVGLWSRPDNDPGWRVPVRDVEQCIRDACRRWTVREITADPFRWQRSLEVLQEEGLPVTEYPQSPARMTPATQRFFEAVLTEGLSHSGSGDLARDVANAIVRDDARGYRIVKESKRSTKRIDLAVAAVMALDRAVTLASYAEVQMW
jgi:phage terminase large subunit-like protein